jgi:hypothetical protein
MGCRHEILRDLKVKAVRNQFKPLKSPPNGVAIIAENLDLLPASSICVQILYVYIEFFSEGRTQNENFSQFKLLVRSLAKQTQMGSLYKGVRTYKY